MKKNSELTWREEHTAAFQDPQHRFTEIQRQAHYQSNYPTITIDDY